MARFTTLALAWLGAAAVALVVAWQGVAIVGRQVTDERPGPLSAAEIHDALETDGTGSAPDGGTTERPEENGVAATTTTTSTTTTTGPPSAQPTEPDESTEQTEIRTYPMIGGTVALQFDPAGVTLLWGDPRPGFQMEAEPEGTGIKVEFESDSHESRVDAWWDGGPQDREREEPDSSGPG